MVSCMSWEFFFRIGMNLKLLPSDKDLSCQFHVVDTSSIFEKEMEERNDKKDEKDDVIDIEDCVMNEEWCISMVEWSWLMWERSWSNLIKWNVEYGIEGSVMLIEFWNLKYLWDIIW